MVSYLGRILDHVLDIYVGIDLLEAFSERRNRRIGYEHKPAIKWERGSLSRHPVGYDLEFEDSGCMCIRGLGGFCHCEGFAATNIRPASVSPKFAGSGISCLAAGGSNQP